MKILFVITQGGPWGGAQKYVHDLATNICRQFHVVVATGESGGPTDLQDLLKNVGTVNVMYLDHLRRNISPVHDLRAIRELRRLYREEEPDIVHLNSSKAGVLGSLAAIGLPCRVIYTAHGWAFTEPLGLAKKMLYFFLEYITAACKDRIIVLSDSDRRLGKKFLFLSKKKLFFTPLEIPKPLHTESHTLSLRDVREDDYVIGSIANFFPNKGVDQLLQAFARAFPENKGRVAVHLALIGDGPERTNLEWIISSLQPSIQKRIRLIGFVSNAAKLLPNFDLFVLPSRKEGLPYVLLEAMSARVPVIATAVGDIPNHIKDKKTGLLVPSQNITALATALRYAYEHQEEMRRMAEASAPPPSTGAMIEKTVSLYRTITSPPAKYR